MNYRTKDGDVLDRVCRKFWGGAYTPEQVLAANPGLAAQGPVLPAGLVIRAPDIPAEKTAAPLIRLWTSPPPPSSSEAVGQSNTPSSSEAVGQAK